MANALQLIGGSVPRGLESHTKERKEIRITDIVRNEITMATIKSYTDLSQSKKLAEILLLESADMLFQLREDKYADSIRVPLTKKRWEQMMPAITPCWSLASLLNYLREIDLFPNIEADEYSVTMEINYYNEEEARPLAPVHNIKVEEESFIDACYEMILKLHELKIL